MDRLPTTVPPNVTSAPSVEICIFLRMLNVAVDPAVMVSSISTTIINIVTGIVAVFGNIVVLVLIAKYTRLHTPSNVFLASLSVSDLIVGSIVQPLSCVRRMLDTYHIHICALRAVYVYTGFLCFLVSLCGVALISTDRFLSVHAPFLHQRLFRTKHYIIIVLFKWIVMLGLTSLPFFKLLTQSEFFFVVCAVMVASLVVIAICTISNAFASRQQRRKITDLTRESGRNLRRDRTMAKTVSLIVGALLLCYTPQIILLSLRGATGDNPTLVYIVDTWFDTFVYINSSLNPIIYCWRMEDWRHAFLKLIGRDQAVREQTFMDQTSGTQQSRNHKRPPSASIETGNASMAPAVIS